MRTILSRALAAVTSAVFLVGMLAGPVSAQGRGAGKGQGPKVAAPQGGRPSTPPGQVNKPSSPPSARKGGAGPAAPIAVKPNLAARLQPHLPGIGIDVAAAGFRNLGQFVAAVHVSRNLDIPFMALKTEMVDHNRTLGAAIQTLKPAVNAGTEVRRAEARAKEDIANFGK